MLASLATAICLYARKRVIAGGQDKNDRNLTGNGRHGVLPRLRNAEASRVLFT